MLSKKWLLAAGLAVALFGFSACKKDAEQAEKTADAQAVEAKADDAKDAKADDAEAAKEAKAEDSAKDDVKADAPKEPTIKDLDNFKLILPAGFSAEGKELDVEKAAAAFESTILKTFGDKSSDNKWAIRLDKIDDVMGDSSYVFHAARTDSADFEATSIGAVSMKGRLYSYNKDADSWTAMGMMPK